VNLWEENKGSLSLVLCMSSHSERADYIRRELFFSRIEILRTLWHALDQEGEEVMTLIVKEFAARANGATMALTLDAAVKWHVLYVKSRQEKALAADLTEMGIKHYLPLIDDVRHYGSRRCKVSLPLFPGYLFLHGMISELYRSERTHRVVHFIAVPDQEQFDREITNIMVAVNGQGVLSPHHRLLTQGCPVEVRSGAFRGLRGVVEDAGQLNRIILQVHVLGRAVSMEIDGRLLDVLSSN
jgi:transcription termination/antitermination protein NusG